MLFMSIKKRWFGTSKKEMQEMIDVYENLIDLQRRDIDFLKKDNNLLKSTIAKISKEDYDN